MLTQLRPETESGEPSPELRDLSIVLVRIENNGWTDIDSHDYLVGDQTPYGIRIRFPGARSSVSR